MSQEKKAGYSHLSGVVTTSRLNSVTPIAVAAVGPASGRRRLFRIAIQPAVDHIVIELPRPEQAGIGLPGNLSLFFVDIRRQPGGIEFVGLADAIDKDPIEIGSKRLGQWIGG